MRSPNIFSQNLHVVKPFHFHQKNKRRDISSEGLCCHNYQREKHNNYRREKHTNYRRQNTTIIGGKNRWVWRPFIVSGHLIGRVLLPNASVEGGDVEIAWSNALVLRHRLACRVSAKSSVTVLVLSCGIQGLGTNPAALGSAGGDVASGYMLQERGAERCIFVRFDLTIHILAL